jgi:hypothetical protein
VLLRIARDLGGSVFSGNGSLMWVLPWGSRTGAKRRGR